MTDDEMLIGGALVLGLLWWSSQSALPVSQNQYPSTQPEGSPGPSSGPATVGVSFQGDGFLVQGDVPIAGSAGSIIGNILGGNIEDTGAGAMNPAAAPRLVMKGSSGTMTATAPDDAAGDAALRQLAAARGSMVPPIGTTGGVSGIRKIGTTGLSVVPPVPRDGTSTLSPEIRRWAAMRSTG